MHGCLLPSALHLIGTYKKNNQKGRGLIRLNWKPFQGSNNSGLMTRGLFKFYRQHLGTLAMHSSADSLVCSALKRQERPDRATDFLKLNILRVF